MVEDTTTAFDAKFCLEEESCNIPPKKLDKKVNALNEIIKDIIEDIICIIKKYPKGKCFLKSLDNAITMKGLIIIAIITE